MCNSSIWVLASLLVQRRKRKTFVAFVWGQGDVAVAVIQHQDWVHSRNVDWNRVEVKLSTVLFRLGEQIEIRKSSEPGKYDAWCTTQTLKHHEQVHSLTTEASISNFIYCPTKVPRAFTQQHTQRPTKIMLHVVLLAGWTQTSTTEHHHTKPRIFFEHIFASSLAGKEHN